MNGKINEQQLLYWGSATTTGQAGPLATAITEEWLEPELCEPTTTHHISNCCVSCNVQATLDHNNYLHKYTSMACRVLTNS